MAGEPLLFIEQVDVGDGLGVAVEVAEEVDGCRGRRLACAKATYSVVMRPAAELPREFEEVLDLLALFGVHLFENGFGTLIGEFGEEIGGGAGIHLFDDAGDLLGVEGLDEGLLHPGLDLFEGLGGDLFIEADEEGLAFGGGELFEDVGDVGRVHLGEAVLLDLEADAAGGVAVDEIDEIPWDDAGAEAAGDGVDGACGEAFEEAANGAAQADFDLANAERGRGLSCVGSCLPDQIDVVDADDLVAVDVDDLLVEQVALEQEDSSSFGRRMGSAPGCMRMSPDSSRESMDVSTRSKVDLPRFGTRRLMTKLWTWAGRRQARRRTPGRGRRAHHYGRRTGAPRRAETLVVLCIAMLGHSRLRVRGRQSLRHLHLPPSSDSKRCAWPVQMVVRSALTIPGIRKQTAINVSPHWRLHTGIYVTE